MKLKLSSATFCKEWTLAPDMATFCARTGMGTGVASARASQLRKLGVNLKKMQASTPVRVDELNALIASIA